MRWRRTAMFVAACTFCVLLAIVACALGYGVHCAKTVAEECRSECHFAQIKSMLLSYYDDHGHFPPTKYQATPDGPAHSWRVLVAPCIDSDYLASYDFSKAWNAPENLRLAGWIAPYFSLDGSNTAHYLAIGKGDTWPIDKPLMSFLVTKGEDSFLIFLYPDSDVQVNEPRY